MTGLTALEPFGILSTEPALPPARVLCLTVAPPLSVQPWPSKLSGIWPGASVVVVAVVCVQKGLRKRGDFAGGCVWQRRCLCGPRAEHQQGAARGEGLAREPPGTDDVRQSGTSLSVSRRP